MKTDYTKVGNINRNGTQLVGGSTKEVRVGSKKQSRQEVVWSRAISHEQRRKHVANRTTEKKMSTKNDERIRRSVTSNVV